MRWKVLPVVLAMSSLALVSPGFARQNFLSITELAVITGGDPEISRVVLKFDLSNIVQNNNLDYAEIQFPSFSVVGGEAMTVQGFRLVTDWDEETVTWDSPWETPGGDYDTTDHVAFRCGPRDTFGLHLDITDVVRPLFEGNPNYGFILKRPSWEGDGFDVEVELVYQALLAAGRVSIYYTRQE